VFVHFEHLPHSPFVTHIQLFHRKPGQQHAYTMLLPASWKSSKESLIGPGRVFFVFLCLKHLQIILLEQKHSQGPLLTKQTAIEYTE